VGRWRGCERDMAPGWKHANEQRERVLFIFPIAVAQGPPTLDTWRLGVALPLSLPFCRAPVGRPHHRVYELFLSVDFVNLRLS
jgi:hypothetical protein